MNQAYSLRAHGGSISSLEAGSGSIISADNLGLVIVWDIKTRRPRVKWQAHQETILTLHHISETLVLTQLRDSLVKFWDISQSPVQEVFELPINSLNFCNVWYHEGYLFTPATVDSNKFDLYLIDANNRFTRILAAVCPHSLYMQQGSIPIDMVRDEDDNAGRHDFGIIMRMVYVAETCELYVGFESGHVVGLHVDLDQKTAAVVYCEPVHLPNPVMSLVQVDNCIISGSTNNKIFVHERKQFPRRIKLDHSGIQELLVDPSNSNLLTLGYWDGVIEQIDWKALADTHFQFQRQLPRVDVTTTNNGAPETSKSAVKLTSMAFMSPVAKPTAAKKSYRDLIKNRAITTAPTLFAGYEDGTIIAFTTCI